jgi:hypothetical protein
MLGVWYKDGNLGTTCQLKSPIMSTYESDETALNLRGYDE